MERAATTDENGRYEVRGVNLEWGMGASHSDYKPRFLFSKDRKDFLKRDYLVELSKVEKVTIRGVIRDDEKRPVEGVSISAGKLATSSARDGRFSLTVPPPQWDSEALTFKKAGFADQEMKVKEVVGQEISVVLLPHYVVEGSVRSSDGRPIDSFMSSGSRVRTSRRSTGWSRSRRATLTRDHSRSLEPDGSSGR